MHDERVLKLEIYHVISLIGESNDTKNLSKKLNMLIYYIIWKLPKSAHIIRFG